MADVVAHLEHAKRVAGADHVGLGGDFDGIDEVVQGLEDVSTYPALFAELARRGWTDAELRKLAGENALRVLGQALNASGYHAQAVEVLERVAELKAHVGGFLVTFVEREGRMGGTDLELAQKIQAITE